MTPLLASASADGAAVVMSPVVPKSHDDPSYRSQRAREIAALFAQRLRPPPRSAPVLVITEQSHGA
ncbi:hypothetical protein [Rhodopseudomonas palustris]|uniref:hypothetical protein n=1 Tax=Rhodopseudomonas palustris TaxID=1076 RepID=UPI000CECCFD8|nr:hypothetical protein [Rhodopseudomonas palustris]PPQ42115.1 hypothetical protein CKO39_18165 [Rhodopseudomonas palustris]